MFTSPRWLLGIVMLYMILTILGNMLDQQTTLLTSEDTSIAGNVTAYAEGATIGQSGTSSAFAGMLPTSIEAWRKMLTWDFSFWYDINPTTGAKTINPIMLIIRCVLFYPLMIVGIIMIIMIVRQSVFGL